MKPPSERLSNWKGRPRQSTGPPKNSVSLSATMLSKIISLSTWTSAVGSATNLETWSSQPRNSHHKRKIKKNHSQSHSFLDIESLPAYHCNCNCKTARQLLRSAVEGCTAEVRLISLG